MGGRARFSALASGVPLNVSSVVGVSSGTRHLRRLLSDAPKHREGPSRVLCLPRCHTHAVTDAHAAACREAAPAPVSGLRSAHAARPAAVPSPRCARPSGT